MSTDSLGGVDAVGVGVLVIVYGSLLVMAGSGYLTGPFEVALVVCSGAALLCSVLARRHDRTDAGLAGSGFATASGCLWAFQRPSSLLSLAVVALMLLGFTVQTYNVATDSAVLRWDA